MNEQIYQRLQTTPTSLAQFCQQWQIIEPDAFGYILTDDFNSNSDVDLLATFHPEAKIGLLDLETIESELKKLLNRPVDLVSKRAIKCSHN